MHRGYVLRLTPWLDELKVAGGEV
eukprot:COSAG01_NODE_17464_length_1149_cov_2.410476_1_plen_23_part_10